MACRQLVEEEEEEEEPPKQTNCPGKRGTTHKKEEGGLLGFFLCAPVDRRLTERRRAVNNLTGKKKENWEPTKPMLIARPAKNKRKSYTQRSTIILRVLNSNVPN